MRKSEQDRKKVKQSENEEYSQTGIRNDKNWETVKQQEKVERKYRRQEKEKTRKRRRKVEKDDEGEIVGGSILEG